MTKIAQTLVEGAKICTRRKHPCETMVKGTRKQIKHNKCSQKEIKPLFLNLKLWSRGLKYGPGENSTSIYGQGSLKMHDAEQKQSKSEVNLIFKFRTFVEVEGTKR